MTRDELIVRTRQLVDEGDRLQQQPTLRGLQTWLQLSDDLLSTAWGSMDRYHLAWLMVGKPKDIVRGRPMTPDEAFVCSSVAGVLLVMRFEGKAIGDGVPGPWTAKARAAREAFIRGEA